MLVLVYNMKKRIPKAIKSITCLFLLMAMLQLCFEPQKFETALFNQSQVLHAAQQQQPQQSKTTAETDQSNTKASTTTKTKESLQPKVETSAAVIDQASPNEAVIALEPKAETVRRATTTTKKPQPRVLIAVITSRKEFRNRIGAIRETWASREAKAAARASNLDILFIVGQNITTANDEERGSTISGSSDEDIKAAAIQAGVDPSKQVLVMKGIVDDEYPPVYKNSAMIESVSNWVRDRERAENDGKPLYDWMFKVDDDTYVNLPGMMKFLKETEKTTKTQYQIYGRQGFGRPGPDKKGLEKHGMKAPYCLGGPGYIMTADTWHKTAAGMQDCVRDFDAAEERAALWHSDVVIGLCVQIKTGAGCWNRPSDVKAHKLKFLQNLGKKKGTHFVQDKEMDGAIAAHPFKAREEMVTHYQRYLARNKTTK